MPDVTLAICTYKRADLLPTTLDSLAQVDKPDVPWELLIVDNACEPQVERICEGYRDRLPIRYEKEAHAGVARARNRAVEAAAAPVLLFADDDVLFDRGWLVTMVRAIQAHPECSFWGGKVEPLWEVEQPGWWDMQRCPMLGDALIRYNQGDEPRYYDPKRDVPFYTCNLALRVETVRQMGMFDPTLGHVGKKRGTGEDSWMIKNIVKNGGKGWYAADALLHHPVPPDRLTRRYARGYAWRQGWISIDMLRRENDPQGRPVGKVPAWVYRLALGDMVRGCGRWAAGMVKANSAAAFEGQFTALFNFSKFLHALRPPQAKAKASADDADFTD